jgi:hypothetical protein
VQNDPVPQTTSQPPWHDKSQVLNGSHTMLQPSTQLMSQAAPWLQTMLQ